MEDKQFEPFKPEKSVVVTITRREAVLLMKLRKWSYGKFVVHKVNGVILRIEPTMSELIEEDTDIDLS